MKAYVGWAIVACFFLGLIGIFVFFQKQSSKVPFTLSSSNGLDVSLASSTISVATSTATDVPSPPPPNIPAGYKEYRNDQYHFSVYYPPELSPKESPDRGDALTVSFQSAAGQPGFRIYVAPINGAKITSERFKMDEPSGVMKEPNDIQIDGVQAVTFFGSDVHIGDTREVWFIRNGFLFEATTYKGLDSWFSNIMQTWQFL